MFCFSPVYLLLCVTPKAILLIFDLFLCFAPLPKIRWFFCLFRCFSYLFIKYCALRHRLFFFHFLFLRCAVSEKFCVTYFFALRRRRFFFPPILVLGAAGEFFLDHFHLILWTAKFDSIIHQMFILYTFYLFWQWKFILYTFYLFWQWKFILYTFYIFFEVTYNELYIKWTYIKWTN